MPPGGRVRDAFADARRRRVDPLARVLGRPPVRRDVGVECEWRVAVDGRPVDFRRLIGRLAADRTRRHPVDPLAVELSDGSVLTADGWEAEVASPPVPWGPDAPAHVTAQVGTGFAELLRLLAPEGEVTTTGFSTHLNVSVPDPRVVSVARRLVRQAGGLLALVCDVPTSPGLLLRPRRGRLEVGVDFLSPGQAQVALVALVGVARLCQRPTLLPAVPVPSEPARERFGWFLPRPSPAALEALRPSARRLWSSARVEALASGFVVDPVDEILAGGHPADRPDWVDAAAVHPPPGPALPERVSGPGWSLERTWTSWDVTVWTEPRAGGRSFVVPWQQRRDFLAAASAGSLDHVLGRPTP